MGVISLVEAAWEEGSLHMELINRSYRTHIKAYKLVAMAGAAADMRLPGAPICTRRLAAPVLARRLPAGLPELQGARHHSCIWTLSHSSVWCKLPWQSRKYMMQIINAVCTSALPFSKGGMLRTCMRGILELQAE